MSIQLKTDITPEGVVVSAPSGEIIATIVATFVASGPPRARPPRTPTGRMYQVRAEANLREKFHPNLRATALDGFFLTQEGAEYTILAYAHELQALGWTP